MKKTLVICMVSGLFGALFAIALTHDFSSTPLPAQDAPKVRPPAQFNGGGAPPSSQFGTLPRTENPRTEKKNIGRPLTAGEFTSEELVNIAVYENGNRSVVNITTHSVRPDAFFMLAEDVEGSGSGSVLDKDGHILTNYHVIAGSREVQVTLYDGSTYNAGLVGQDPQNDTAILRIEAPRELLFPVTLGDSSRIKVGQKVYAIGNPLGLERTMTVGIVSSLNRTLPSRNGRTMKSIVQIDAALNRGNSGGPLLSSRGQLIGMNTAIASPSGAGENIGIGFAIPVNTLRRVIPQLIEHGRVIRADIGVTRVYETERGLVIATLSPGGPAERAGLRGFRVVRRERRRGPFISVETFVDRDYADTIVAVDGRRTNTADDLLTAVESKKPGQETVVTVIREGKQVQVTVILGESDG